jgi:hypothetical protein
MAAPIIALRRDAVSGALLVVVSVKDALPLALATRPGANRLTDGPRGEGLILEAWVVSACPKALMALGFGSE